MAEEHHSHQTIAQIAEALPKADIGLDFGKAVLVPTAIDVVKKMNHFLGDLARYVHLKVKCVEGSLDSDAPPPVYLTGIYVPGAHALPIKQTIVSKLNTLLTNSDALNMPHDRDTVHVSTEQLTTMLGALARQTATSPLTRSGVALTK